ncbi:MAG: TylF/MycF/NovP-related O-methyltransferase [Microthrixaceae bacterium]|nr:TylF/MycF family methyltransferase [Microthrixaceae bacterium]MCO5320230.1 TylF/MycF family methyltransferase [Microthrixaceae bacterium]
MQPAPDDPTDDLVGPATDPLDPLAKRYLELLRRCLTREAFLDQEWWDVRLDDVPDGRESVEPMLASQGWRLVRRGEPGARGEGRDWPPTAETMIGTSRLDNLTACCVAALQHRVPGDFVETGVWRGGATILMRGVLEAFGDSTRSVWVADSFEGLPEPDPQRYPADEGLDWSGVKVLKVSADQVRANFDRYGLLDDRVRFLEGWFSDTLPSAPVESIAVLRLDGDLYESTMDALVSLEPKVSPGGFVIVDDYGGWEPCRAAVNDYRAEHGIVAPIHSVDWTGAWWQK